MKAAISSMYTGSRAEQVMNGVTRIVASLSRLFSMVRVAIIAGTAHAYAESRGMKALPFRPIVRITRSAISAALAR